MNLNPLNLETVRFAVMDIETTGIPTEYTRDFIVEVAAVVLDGRGHEVASFESLVTAPITDLWAAHGEAFRLNCLSSAMLFLAPPASVVARALRLFLHSHGVQLVTAWGVPFDFHGDFLGSPEWLGREFPVATCLRTYFGDAHSSLDKTVRRYGYTFPGKAHTAMADARAAALFLTEETTPAYLTGAYAAHEQWLDSAVPVRPLLTRAQAIAELEAINAPTR